MLNQDSSQRLAGVRRVLWVTLFCNLAVAVTKMVVGVISSRTTVLADGFHSLLDGSNNVIALLAMWVAARPPDAEHPYGHRKFENLAAMAIGGMVMLLAWEILENIGGQVWSHYREGAPPLPGGQQQDLVFAVVVGLSILVNIFVAVYESRSGKKLGSPLLVADAAHTRADAMVTGLGVLSLLVGRIAWWVDPVLALGVICFLIRAAWEILDENLMIITERQRLKPEAVRDVAQSVEGVLNAHAIRSHGPVNDLHVDLHVVVPEEMSAREVEEVEKRVETAVRIAFSGVTQVSVRHQTEAHDPAMPVWKDDEEA